MVNPILQKLSQPLRQQTQQSNLAGLVNMLKGGNVDQMMQNMMQTNPQFRQFVMENQGMNPAQIANKYGIDINAINNLIK